MKIFSVAYFNNDGNLVTNYIAARNKAKVRNIMEGFSPLLIAEYRPNNPDVFYDSLTDEEKDQFIKAFMDEI